MSRRVRLVLLSFTMLFVELALIRWTGSNIFDLAHFTNFVLLGSFLGIGVGFLRSRSGRDLSSWAPVVLCGLVLFVFAFRTGIDSGGSDLIFVGGTQSVLPAWVSLPVIFVVVATAMAFIGEAVARVFMTLTPLEAYSLDILGSLLGIGAFAVISFVGAPPVVWGLIAGVLLVGLSARRPRPIQIAAALAIVLVLGVESTRPNTSWSPYNKIYTSTSYDKGYQETLIWVNGLTHQRIIPASADRNDPSSLYWEVYRRVTNHPKDVLIIGAGTGHDTAVALQNGVERIDAVEIDPQLYQIGRQMNPDRPYDDPRVHVHVDDGRAFLRQTSRSYDLVVFALPDSLTLVAGQSSLRLESYLFTAEATAAAKARLKPDGAFAEYNYYWQQWLVDRLALGLDRAFSNPPCYDQIGSTRQLALLTASSNAASVSCPVRWKPTVAAIPAPATDDHPFPYLRVDTVPGFYLLSLGLILLVSLVAVRVTSGPLGALATYADLSFMGAAFLLLETKNVVQFALLFGSTWLVNALVFAGILATVFLAVQVARQFRLPSPPLLYGGLLAALALAWLVPPQSLLQLDAVPRFAVAVALPFAPIFFANLIFAARFRDTASSTIAFAANLLGAIVGGVLEYSALVIGYRALLIIVALLYGMAFLLRVVQPVRGAEVSP